MESLENFLCCLLMSDDYHMLTNKDGKLISISDNLDGVEIKKINDKVVQISNNYYEVKEKEIIIRGKEYNLKLFVNVTKYYNKIVDLKQEVKNLKQDSLTTLPNRGEVNKQIERVKKANSKRIFVMCDVDDFKKINDLYGHDMGDKVLKFIGNSIKSNIRGDDFAGRFGGEEFLLIFNTDDIDSILKRLEQIRVFISNNSDDLLPEIYFSAGIALFNENDLTEETIKKADIALYHVKNNGKNGNALYDDLEKKPIMIERQKYLR